MAGGEVVLQEGDEQGEGEGSVEEEIAVALHGAAVVWIEVDGVGIKGESAITEEEGRRGKQGVGEVGLVLGCFLVSILSIKRTAAASQVISEQTTMLR